MDMPSRMVQLLTGASFGDKWQVLTALWGRGAARKGILQRDGWLLLGLRLATVEATPDNKRSHGLPVD